VSASPTVSRPGAAAAAPAGAASGRGRSPEALAALVLALPALLFVLFVHGFLPGYASDAPTTYLSEGSIECLNDLGASALWSWCHDYGEPLGYPLLTGGPVLALGALVMYLPGVDAGGAYLLASAIFLAIALAGGYALLRRLGAGPLVALGAATAFLLAPTVLGLRSFGGTFFGFALLPAYAYADLLAFDAVGRARGRALVLAVLGYGAVKTAALFMDGYSFIAANLVSAALLVSWLLSADATARRRVGAVALFLLANLVALALYTLYVPGTYEPNPIEIFRAMGLDVVTLVAPTEWNWTAAKLNYASDHRDLWGDGTNSAFNYVGFVCVALAVVYLLTRPRQPAALGLAAAGLVALVLALGPSLKLDDAKPPASGPITFQSYLMPEGQAVADLPWAKVFTALPGLESMRATYRWYAVTRLALIVLAALAIAALLRAGGRRRWLALALAAIGLIELLPNVPLYTQTARAHHRQIAAMQGSAGAEVRDATRSGERAFFLNYDGTHNDFLANYLAASADLRAYNAGGDKNSILATGQWPPEVGALAAANVNADALAQAFEAGNLDVVVAPFFHLRWSSYAWPPAPADRTGAEKAFAPMLRDPRFEVDRRRWIATIRPAS
jgi:hypothetical protein